MSHILHLNYWRKGAVLALVQGALMMTALAAFADEWPMGGRNAANWRTDSSAKINPGNVAELKERWVFAAAGDVSATPAVVGGIVYFPDFAGYFYAVNAETGDLVWKNKVSAWTGIAGDYARNDPLIYGNMVILGDQAGFLATWDGDTVSGAGARLIAVNALTGKVIWVSQLETSPTAAVTGSPVIYAGTIYVGIASGEESLSGGQGFPCCVSRGSVVAVNVTTGKKLWQTYMVPDNNGITGGYSGGGIWDATPVVDPNRDLVYVGTGNNYSVPASVEACFKNTPNNKFCTNSFDYFDAVVALDRKTGAVRWANRALSYDAWNLNCVESYPAGPVPGPNCPNPVGPDYDFGAGPNLLTIKNTQGQEQDILGIGEKSGIYWAFDPDDGSLIWSTQVGPRLSSGGIEWGAATDGVHIYVPISNNPGTPYKLQPSQTPVNGGSWSALDPATGNILWQTATPGLCTPLISGYAQGCKALSPPSVGGGVVFVGSMDLNPKNPTMFALDGSTGKVLWSFVAGGSVLAGPAIVGNSVYWGSGYSRFGSSYGIGNKKLFAFSIGGAAPD